MEPRSPPEPFTHRILRVAPSSGSIWSSLELVLPPPKLVMRRSDPRRFDLYLSSSGGSSLEATASSHLSSRNRSFVFAAMMLNLNGSKEKLFLARPVHHST